MKKHIPQRLRKGLWLVGLFMLLSVEGIIPSIFILWVVGVIFGINPFDQNINQTQHAQLIMGSGIVTFALILILLPYIKRLPFIPGHKPEIWRYVRIELLIIAWLTLVSSIGVASYLFWKGQHGGDYGCSRNIPLYTAVLASYPINTDTGGGTAFAIDGKGTLVTAYHVIDKTKSITTPDGNSDVKLKVLQTDPALDIALLRYDHPTPDFLPLTDEYTPADPVYEVGWPDNLYPSGQPTITSGIISRDITTQDIKNSDQPAPAGLTYIQTDAATNSGDSGAPLVNYCGAVGVMVATSSLDETSSDTGAHEEGISYAVAARTVREAFHLR